tara:strand:- start:105 stop:1013 length:909 start_codon:yes stop_codon:yes gene_type:complete
MKKKKVLITGSHGFLARNLSRLLSKNSYKVYGIGNGKWKKNNYKKWGYDYLVNGDVNIKNLLKNFNKVDFIIHCAGRVIGLKPDKDFIKNVLPTQSILEFIRLKKITPKIIFISTIAVSKTDGKKPIKENFLNDPKSHYAFNKKLSEDLFEFYSQKLNIDVLVARTTSLYGEGLERQFIFDACRKISKNNPNFFGTGNEVRDWLHISDMTNLILKFIKKSFKKFTVVNCGSGKGNKVKDVLKLIIKEFNQDLRPNFNKISDTNPSKLVADVTKAKKFGWTPKKKLKDGLAEYVRWFKNKQSC